MRLRVFASGSKGNALAVRSTGGQLLLVDLGLSCLDLTKRAKACDVDVGEASGVLFTHDHSDHYKGVATFHKRHPEVPLYANGDTADAIAVQTGVADGWAVFETAVDFDLGDFHVTPFSTSHDAADPVGFLLEDVSAGLAVSPALFVGTDTGIVTTGFREAFRRCDLAVLESNHDPVLLETSDRPAPLKQRIAGRSGHLSNDDAADLFRAANPPRLQTLLLAHLSEQCNSTHLARAAMEAAFRECGRKDIRLDILAQHEPSDLFVCPTAR